MNELIKSLFPILGSALGPAGAMLGSAAASFIGDRLGLETKTVEAVKSVLESGNLSPEQITNLKLAEADMKKFLADNNIKLEEVAAADRASARDMLKATAAKTPAVLTYLITVGFFGVLTAMFVYPDIKESAPLMIMLGSLGTAWTGACAFWFGTTHNSAQKTTLLANSQPAK